MLTALFAVTLFLSAALSFVVQPLLGKQLLPLAGGTPAVWNTCLVFFQAALLLGYLYADRLRGRVGVHLGVLVAGGVLLWVGGLRANAALLPADSAHPTVGVFLMLAAAVGGPFVAVAATAPLVQSWYARTGRRNPYPLYAASNAGSFAGLIGYPLIVEPSLTIGDQRAIWAVGFAAVAGLVAGCGLLARRAACVSGPVQPPRPVDGVASESLLIGDASRPGRRNRPAYAGRSPYRWLFLAAIPSAFLVSVTAHLTTDVAPVPLVWVVPLGLYLLTFVVVFAWWPDAMRRLIGRLAPVGLCALAVTLLMRATEPLALVAAVHLGAFVLVAVMCHGELAADKPPADQLTGFYLWISAGGVLGGLLVTFVAPVVFARVGNAEYPLIVILAALVRPTPAGLPAPGWRRSDFLYPVALATLTVVLLAVVPQLLGDPPKGDPEVELIDRAVRGGLTFGLPAGLAFALVWRPARFALCLAAVFLAGAVAGTAHGDVLAVLRNDYGTLRVSRRDGFVRLMHGTTEHGMQRVGDDPPEPLMYYHRKGPLGRLIGGLPDKPRRVGAVGLGCGATAAYARPGDRWTFFEIDPNVERVARDERYFTFLARCQGEVNVVLGDARRRLVDVPDGEFDLLILDAFSSDAVPAHLLTREAFALYRAKLAPSGVLAFHVSNRYLDLAPLVGRLARDGDPTAAVRWCDDVALPADEVANGRYPSVWVGVAAAAGDFGSVPRSWQVMDPRPGPVWTDDFSNLLGVWKRE